MAENDYNNPKKRIKEFASIRIYEDDRINEILQLIQSLKLEIKQLKSQISAHDYNIGNLIKSDNMDNFIKPDCLECEFFGNKCTINYADCHRLTGFTIPCLNCFKHTNCKYEIKAIKKNVVIIECKHYEPKN